MGWKVEVYDPNKSGDTSLVAFPPDKTYDVESKDECVTAIRRLRRLKQYQGMRFAIVAPDGERDVLGLPGRKAPDPTA